MSNRRQSRHQSSSGSAPRITDEQIIGLMSKLQQLLPELRNRGRSEKVRF
uniref:Uncharacterized protein n=1 Tax=Kalanchoe fedtschenkoi TaxID=63787 RepID=A0A7N1A7M3_KALFE